MPANFRSVLHFALSCCNILLVSGHPVSLVDTSAESLGNSVPDLSSLPPRSVLPRSDNSTTASSSGGNDGPGDRNHLLEANLTAAIAVAAGLGVLLVLVGLMSAFRMGWSKGLEYQAKEGRKLTSAGSSEVSTNPTFVPWQGEPPIIRGMSERDMDCPYGVAVGGLGRHSFRPEKGVYKIHDRAEPGAIRSIVEVDKGKAKDIGTW